MIVTFRVLDADDSASGDCQLGCDVVYSRRKRMPSGGGPGLQSRAGGSRTVPGGFDSHPFRFCFFGGSRWQDAVAIVRYSTSKHVTPMCRAGALRVLPLTYYLAHEDGRMPLASFPTTNPESAETTVGKEPEGVLPLEATRRTTCYRPDLLASPILHRMGRN